MAQSETPNDFRDQIRDWLNEDGIPIQDRQLNEQQVGELQFLLESRQPPTPSIMIYSTIRHPDRIIIQGGVNLSPEHLPVFNNTWQEDRRNGFLLDLQNRLTVFNVRHQLINQNNQFTGVRINFSIMNAELTKSKLLDSFVRIQEIVNTIRNIMSINLGTGLQPPPANDDTPDFIT